MACSPLKVNRHFGGTCHLHFRGQTVGQARNQHEAGNKMEAARSPETSVDFHRATRHYVAEGKLVLSFEQTGPLLLEQK
jgi:hypothetical protein